MSTATTSLKCKFPDAYTGEQRKYWVEIQLLDEMEQPVADMPYVAENAATRSQCASYTGKSDASGIIRIEGLHPLEITLHLQAMPLVQEMEKRALRVGRTEDDSTVKPKAMIEGYEYRYLKIGQLCDKFPDLMPEWQDKANPPQYHFPDRRFSGQTLKRLNCRYVFEVCPFRAWSLILHQQKDYSIVNAYNLAIMADLSYFTEREIIQYFEHECLDLSTAPKLSDKYDYYAVVKDVPFSQRYINPRFVTTAVNIIQHDTQLFYISNDEHVIVAWRGSQELRDWITDATFSPQVCPSYLSSTGKIHKGFLDAFECAKEKSPRNFNEIINLVSIDGKVPFLCGHSLGGALALIYAAELKSIKPLLYTYGMPRVFTADTVLQLTEVTHYRHVNDSDTVTSVPPDANLYNWFYKVYGPIGTLLGMTWSVAELLTQKITGIKMGDCFWHHGDIVIFYYTTQVVESLQCEGSISAPKCRRIKYRLPKKTRYYLIPSFSQDKNISAKNQDIQFIRSLSDESMKRFFPENTNPDLDSIITDPRNHFMPAAYMPFINNQLIELVCPDENMKTRESRAAFEKQLSDAGIPDNERERNRLFAALQRLVSETLKVTEQLPEGATALERFRKTKKEYGV